LEKVVTVSLTRGGKSLNFIIVRKTLLFRSFPSKSALISSLYIRG
jgi:hypothetical protein